MSAPRELSVLDAVIIGCGEIAGGYDEEGGGDIIKTHAGAYTAHAGFRMVACVEPDQARRLAFMEYWDIPNGFEDMKAFLSSGIQADVASMCVPTELHRETLQDLLNAPVRAVFCEKPISHDGTSSRQLVEGYAAANKPMAVNYFRRWDMVLQALGDEIASGVWGGLQNAVGTYAKGVLNCGSHMFDLFHLLVGERLEVKSVLKRRDDYSPDDPTLDAILESEHGAPVYLVGSDHRHFFTFELELTFEKGRISIEDLGRSLRVRRVVADPDFPNRWTLPLGKYEKTEIAQAMVRAVDNVHGHVVKGIPLASDGQSALAAEQICHDLIAMAADLEKE